MATALHDVAPEHVPAGLSRTTPIVGTDVTLQRQDPRAPAGITPFRAAVAHALAYIDAHLVTPREIVVDLSALPFAYGFVRSELIAVANIADRHGVAIRILGATEPAREALRMTHLEHRFHFDEVRRG